MADSIESEVIAAILRTQPELDPSQVTPEAAFEDLGMNSLDALALVNELEEGFNIFIPNEEAMGMRTVGEAIESIRRLAAP
ncbi:MAG TPA: phosphopantetheine-binding protein [Thermoanaerobaculia bacterium]